MGGHVQRRLFTSSQEVRDVLHLYEGHIRLLEPDRRGYGKIDESGKVSYTGPATW